MMKFYKYQGAGNDFLIADNREGNITEKDGVLTAVLEDGSVWTKAIADICDRRYGVGADGLMLLDAGTESESLIHGTESEAGASSEAESDSCPRRTDFHMTYFNSDGSGGMMCGNGGRCMVAFAHDCGVPGQLQEETADSDRQGWMVRYSFTAADGLHQAYIYEDSPEGKIIALGMKNVDEAFEYEALTGVTCPSKGCFLDTGTRHYVRFVEGLEEYDVVAHGRQIRYGAQELQPVGANVNFVEPSEKLLRVRTYEKGVEDETYACGTGIVASALAAYIKGIAPSTILKTGRILYDIRARRDSLTVDFMPSEAGVAEDIFLTGPACKVCKIEI